MNSNFLIQAHSETAIVVACVAPSPSLFKKSERGQHQHISGGSSHNFWSSFSHRLASLGRRTTASKEVSMDNLNGSQGRILKAATASSASGQNCPNDMIIFHTMADLTLARSL